MTQNNPLHIAMIAGEVSGDMLGADLMQSLKLKEQDIVFSGIGGRAMTAQGLHSFFPMEEISLMGFAEILPHIFRLKRRIKETIAQLRQNPPDILITIDSPGFTFRIAKALADLPCPKLHYVAPTVWAYKPERAAKTAAIFDHLLTVLPFEPPYFEKEGLTTSYIGHPTIWRHRELEHGGGRAPNDTPLLAMLPGSRKGELKQHLPIFRETVAQLQVHLPNLSVAMPLPAHLVETATPLLHGWPCEVRIVHDDAEKIELFQTCSAALAKSGTVSLELACAGAPTVTTYKANPISAFIVRRMLKTPYVNLVNVVANAPIIPEFLQEECNPNSLSNALLPMLTDASAQQKQRAKIDAVLDQLGRNDAVSPSDKAAEIVLRLCHASLRGEAAPRRGNLDMLNEVAARPSAARNDGEVE